MANWLVLAVSYATLYTGRYNLSLANLSLSDQFGIDKQQFGFILSSASVVYGLSALVNGPITDRIGGRRALLLGLFGSAFFNLVFGFGAYASLLSSTSAALVYFVTVWSLNMYFQSYVSLSLIKINSAWFSVEERGRFVGFFGGLIQIGRLIVLPLGGLLVTLGPWPWVFFLPGLIIAAMGVLATLCIAESPKIAGYSGRVDDGLTQLGRVSLARGTFKAVVGSKILLLTAAASFCFGVVRIGFDDWAPRFVQEGLHLPLSSVFFQATAIGIGVAAIGGALGAGYLSDYCFASRRPPVAFLGVMLQFAALLVIGTIPCTFLVGLAMALHACGASMAHGMITAASAMDYGGQRFSGSVAGLLDGVQYLGGLLAGWPLGLAVQTFGWQLWAPALCGVAATTLLILDLLRRMSLTSVDANRRGRG